jgi:hypothetical protein
LYVGIASDTGVDPFFPAVYGYVTSANVSTAAKMVDMCLAHVDEVGAYHYHAFAPCVVDSSYSTTPESCDSITACTDELITYGEDAYVDSETLTVIGISKDGHIMYGPYKSDGTLVSDCDVDVCNGAVINGVYGYYATPFHPYF